MSWFQSSFEGLVKKGICAGEDSNGRRIYVGRTKDKDGNYFPASIQPELRKSFYVRNGIEETADYIETLDDEKNYEWVQLDEKSSENAALINQDYIGRSYFNGNVVVGRVDRASKQLIGSFNGEVFSLPRYEILTYKLRSTGASQSSSSYQASHSYTMSHSSSSMKVVTGQNLKIEEIKSSETITRESYTELIEKIRGLENERSSFLNEKKGFDDLIQHEKKKVSELSLLVKKLKIENARYLEERNIFEEKYSFELRKNETADLRVGEYAMSNSYLSKRILKMEQAVKIEQQLVESISDKLRKSETQNKTLINKIGNIEEKARIQQEKIFELESEILISSTNTESLTLRLSEYEASIKHLRITIESIEKKLEISSNDCDHLLQRVALLTKTLRNYQSQIECMGNKLQTSKTVISSAHAELSKANAQVAKYQVALSGCYTLNGELMSKISEFSSASQFQSSKECDYHLIDLGFSVKSSTHSTKYKSSHERVAGFFNADDELASAKVGFDITQERD